MKANHSSSTLGVLGKYFHDTPLRSDCEKFWVSRMVSHWSVAIPQMTGWGWCSEWQVLATSNLVNWRGPLKPADGWRAGNTFNSYTPITHMHVALYTQPFLICVCSCIPNYMCTYIKVTHNHIIQLFLHSQICTHPTLCVHTTQQRQSQRLSMPLRIPILGKRERVSGDSMHVFLPEMIVHKMGSLCF